MNTLQKEKLYGMLLMLPIIVLLSANLIYMSKHKCIEPVQASVPVNALEEVVEQEETTYYTPCYGFNYDEVYLMAQLLCGDMRQDGDGEYDIDYQTDINYTEVNKVFSVVMNRVRDSRFPDTVAKVILQTNQFSVMPKNTRAIPSDKALHITNAWCDTYDRYENSTDVPDNHVFFRGNGLINITRP